jgi:hypothetical protein
MTKSAAILDKKTKQIKKRDFYTIKHLKLKKADRISERTRGVHQIFSTQNRPRSSWSTRRDLRSQPSVDPANYANNAEEMDLDPYSRRDRRLD